MASEKLPYNPHRKHRYYEEDHPLTAKQRKAIRRRRKIQSANKRDSAFGKINWDAYEHRELWDMVQSADPGAMGSAAHRWAQLALRTDSTTAEIHKTVQKLLLSWRGESAVRAAESASKLTSWAAEASRTMRQVGEKLDAYTSAVVEARNRIPEPVFDTEERHFRQGYDVKASGPSAAILADQLLDDRLPSHKQAVQAKAEAVQVMEQYESDSKDVHDTLPTFADAPEVSVEITDDRPGGGTGASSVGGGTGGAGGAGTGGAAMPAGPAAAGVGGGVAGGGAADGPRSGASPLGGGALSASERMGSGMGGQAAAGSAAASARGSGVVGMPGMIPPAAHGGQGSEDGEHRNRYAQGMSGVDMLEDLPPAYPPVLGEQ